MLNKMYLDELMQNFNQSFSNYSQAVVFLEAGHYNPRYGATEFSKISLGDALIFAKMLIKKYGKNVKIIIGILVDNLGLECSEDSCSISVKKNA